MTTTKTRTSFLPSNPARGAVRARREINRRKMKAPRPAITPAIAFRIRQWYAAIEQARDEKDEKKRISLGCDRYLRRIKGQRTVAHGGFADVRDVVMGGWLGRSRRTVMRYRAEAVRAGLLEDEGTAGRDHKPCMVRPILPDGPVFSTDISVTHSVTKPAHQPSQSKPTKTTPPTPSVQPEQKECGPALVAPDVVSGGPPAAPPEREEQRPSNDAVAAPGPITFDEVWEASDKAGPQSYAETEFDKLSDADKTVLAAILKRDRRLQTGSNWVGKWLKHRRWPTLSAPVTKDENGSRVDADKPNGEAWRRYWAKHGLRGLPVGRDGCFTRNLPSLWPPEQ